MIGRALGKGPEPGFIGKTALSVVQPIAVIGGISLAATALLKNADVIAEALSGDSSSE